MDIEVINISLMLFLNIGWDNIKHEILYTNLTGEEAYKKEIELIKAYKSNKIKYGYNQSLGGECSAIGVVFTDERRKKISDAHKGMQLSLEARKKISVKNKGKKISDAQKQILSETRKGINNPMYGKHFSKEHKDKLGIANGIPVRCIETNTIYFSANEASKQTGINDWCIGEVCKHKRKTAGKLHWEYWR